MRLEHYILNEKYNMYGTMIGYEINRNVFKGVIKEISDLLQENKIGYDVIENPHITIAQITGKYAKDELKRDMDKIGDLSFNPKGLTLFWGFNVKKWFVVAEYKVRQEFIDKFKELSEKYEVRTFPGGIKPHTSLVTINNDIPKDVLEKIRLFGKNLPKIRTEGVALFNNKFKMEYER
jgi:hypothetical protein